MYASQAEYFLEDILSRIKNQGDAFISPDDYIEGGLQYWEKEIKHYESDNF